MHDNISISKELQETKQLFDNVLLTQGRSDGRVGGKSEEQLFGIATDILKKVRWRPRCFFKHIFVSSHMYPENPKGTQVIVGSMNMGYDKYPTLSGIKLTTCSVPSARQFH